MARVCRSCGLGVMLETRKDIAPSHRDAFLVIDSALLVQALSWRAETLLGVTEESAVNRPVVELLAPADAEAGRPAGFAAALADAAAGADDPVTAFVRPWNTFGVRLRARIASCGPPRAALVVLEDQPSRRLRVVE
jgi:PAS domain-containing protein